MYLNENDPEPNWENTQMAFKQTNICKRIWLIKYLNNRLPIGEKHLQWNCSTNNLCPRCDRLETYRCHVIIKCAHPEARQIWLKAIQDLIHWME
jgi:hypothetical protein